MFAITLNSSLKSVKKRTVTFVFVLVCCVLIAIVCVAKINSTPADTAKCKDCIEYSTVVGSESQAVAFVEQFSYEAEQLYSLQEIYIPLNFNEKYTQYNELQKRQGLDLSDYKGEKCRLYIYKLKDFEIDGNDAYMSIIVCNDRVIGGDVSTMVDEDVNYTFCGK